MSTATATATSRPREEQSQETANKPCLIVVNGEIKVTSLDIAEKFEKLHKNVLRDIEALECSEKFRGLNFELTQQLVVAGATKRKIPVYEITRDGFSILVMGFTGKKAMQWKERYIAAFNMMERRLLEEQRKAFESSHAQHAHQPQIPELQTELSIGEKIMVIRIRKGLTYMALGHKVYIEKKIKQITHPNLRIQKIETGAISPKKYLKGELEAISEVLGVSVEFFLGDNDNKDKTDDSLVFDIAVLSSYPNLPQYIKGINSTALFDKKLSHDVSKRLADYIGSCCADNCTAQIQGKNTEAEREAKISLSFEKVNSPEYKFISKAADNLLKHLYKASENHIERLSIICKKLLQLDPDDKKQKLGQSYLTTLFNMNRKTVWLDIQPLIQNHLMISSRGYMPTAKLFHLVSYLKSLPHGHKHTELMTMLFNL